LEAAGQRNSDPPRQLLLHETYRSDLS